MNDHSLTEGAQQIEHRLTVVEQAVVSIREVFELKLEKIEGATTSSAQDMVDVKSDVKRINGSIAQAIRDRDADRGELGKTQSLVVDQAGDIKALQDEVKAIQEARALEHAAQREDSAEERGVQKGRWQVLGVEAKVAAFIFSLGGGAAGVIAVIAYILELRPI